MIAYVSGKLAEIDPTFAIVDCQGIGYLIKISLNTFTQIKDRENVKLHTYFMVREDAQILYGFAEAKEQTLFEQLISINGVGGNTAMMILSSLTAEELFMAIRNEDTLTLKQVKGIGAKTAARIVLELKDKISLEGAEASAQTSVANKVALHQKQQEAVAALVNLGLAKSTMEKRVAQIIASQGSDISVPQIIKLALRNPS